jgi:hypothetical protein
LNQPAIIEPRFSYNPLTENEFTRKSPEKIIAENTLVRKILEAAKGSTFYDETCKLLLSKNFDAPDKETFEKIINSHLENYRVLEWLNGRCQEELSQETKIQHFKELFQKTCTQIYLEQSRNELSSWINLVEKGKALFVDCPMGVGKTYSIAKTLAQNPNFSAIVFLPTRKLCRKFVQDLKKGILLYDPSLRTKYAINTEEGDEDDEDDFDKIVGFSLRYTMDTLEHEVYYADGINREECPFYDEFLERYRHGWFTKNNICKKCDNFLSERTGQTKCRFRLHHIRAPLSRIIVAPHLQYKNYSKQSSFRKWFKEGYWKTNENYEIILDENNNPVKAKSVERDFFIIDEDIILNHCYKPRSLTKSQLRPFISAITDFLTGLPDKEDIKVDDGIINSLDVMLARFDKCDKTSIVPPINKDFKISRKIRDFWEKEYSITEQMIPEFMDDSSIIGNHMDYIEHAIKNGFVVQSYERKFISNETQISKKIKKAYLPNPTSFDLAKLPPHVFFDGTRISEKFIAHKIKNAKIAFHKINLDSLWKYRIFQNTATDLSTTKTKTEEPKVKDLLNSIFTELGPDRRYFIVSSKENSDSYLKDFIDKNFRNYQRFVGYYGNIKGLNDAKDCDVALMLGSFIPSDAVEIAMGIEFIHDNLKANKILPTKNNVWSFAEHNFRRRYKNDFLAIEELATTHRRSEHRQAIARTRYLFHDVDFYILSKEPITSYEHFFTSSEAQQFATDFFLKEPRSDSKYEEIKQKILVLLDQNGKMREMDLFKILGNSRTTLRKHLGSMVGDVIVRCGKAYSLPPFKEK